MIISIHYLLNLWTKGNREKSFTIIFLAFELSLISAQQKKRDDSNREKKNNKRKQNKTVYKN